MKRIGVTGSTGFVGKHMAEFIKRTPDCELVPFERGWFNDAAAMRLFVRQCDVIIHLAGITRHEDQEFLYNENVRLCQVLIDAMESEKVTPLVMFSSSIHEMRDIAYGRAKMEGGRRFCEWADKSGANFARYIFPNVYGPEARPFYCSFVANFAYQLTHNQEPKIQIDAPIRLVYVNNLCRYILSDIYFRGVDRKVVPYDVELKVSEVLAIFRAYLNEDGSIKSRPEQDGYHRDLYDTLLSYTMMK